MIRTLLEALFGWFFRMFSSEPKRIGAGNLPVDFETSVAGLTLRVDRATMLARVEPMLHVVGVVQNFGDQVVREMFFEVEGISGEESRGRGDVEVIGTHQAALQPGDSHAFDFKVALRGDVQRVSIRATGLDAERARPARPSKEAPVDWALACPSGVAVVFRERLHEVRKFGDGTQGFCHLSLEVENSGREVKVLKVQVRFMDDTGEVLDNREALVAWAGGPELKGGERRLVHVISKVPSNYSGYSGTVVEIL